LSSNQVAKSVNLDGLKNWVGKIPEDVLNNLNKLAPMLKFLGYDTKANPPNYENFYENLIIKQNI
jgi:hypothetical protein